MTKLHQISGRKQERIFILSREHVFVQIIDEYNRYEYKVPFEETLSEPVKIIRPASIKHLQLIKKLLPYSISVFPMLTLILWWLMGMSNTTTFVDTFKIVGILTAAVFASLQLYIRAKERKTVTYLLLSNGAHELAFRDDLPSTTEVEKFVASFIELRKDYLAKKYADVSDSLSIELFRYNALKEQGAITEAEFLKIKNDLLKDITGEKKSPGFLN